jgi:uncharacterized protein (TIGR01777 family)
MNILATGSGGLVGSALVRRLTETGHEVGRLVRSAAGPSEIHWSPEAGQLEAARLEGFDAVVHLAGESIVGRWTEAKKRRILESRVKGTRCLSKALSRLSRRPKALICASAIGFYGDRGDETLDERSVSGSGFLSEVCRQWEEAAIPAAEAGIRIAHLRFGIILSPAGGALAKILLPFKMGVGGVLGTGRQWMSWISLSDVVGVIEHALAAAALQGSVNVVSPHPVTNREFTKTLGAVLSRPTLFPMPAFAARLVFGEMADALLLGSARVEPARLLESGYRFRHPFLAPALSSLLERP